MQLLLQGHENEPLIQSTFGAAVGYICILHTWGSEMNFHPHIHTILLGGGLTSKNEWKTTVLRFSSYMGYLKVFVERYKDELKNL